jgi:subtilisin-like proprotein convertase family protein
MIKSPRLVTIVSVLLSAFLAPKAIAQVFSSSSPTPIPDSPTLASDLQVTSGPASIFDLNLVLHIDHTWDSDLDLVLLPPGGADYLHLSSDNGGSGDDYQVTRFDDAAPNSISGGFNAPFNGNFRPEGGSLSWLGSIPLPPTPLASFAALNGRPGSGTWRLLVDDDTNQQTGTLQYWSLEFNGAVDPTGPAPVPGRTQPLGTGLATPGRAEPLAEVLLSVQVLPAEIPPSTGLTARVDATPIGGLSVVLLRDDGTGGDDVAGDLNFKARVTVEDVAVVGDQPMEFVVADSQGRTATGTIPFVVLPPPAPNDLCSEAIEVPSGGPFPYLTPPVSIINNALDPEVPLCITTASRDVWYRFTPSQTSIVELSTCVADAPGCSVPDTVMSVFESVDGSCDTLIRLACLDDSCGLRQAITLEQPFVAGHTYYIQLARFGNADPNFETDDIQLRVRPTTDVSGPSGVGAAVPEAVHFDEPVLLTVTVTPGTAPESTGLAVLLDATPIGRGTLQLNDLGLSGDLVAGDLVFSVATRIAAGPIGINDLNFTVVDAEQRFGFGVLSLRHLPPASVNDLCEGATTIPSGGPFPFVASSVEIQGNALAPEAPMCANAGASVWYRLTPSAPSYFEFTTCASATPQGTVPDTVLAVYESDGTCGSLQRIACVDDGDCGLRSTVRPVLPLDPAKTYFIQVASGSTSIPADGFSRLQLAVRQLPAVGGCCLPTGCEILTSSQCSTRGGTFLGVGITCEEGGSYTQSTGSAITSLPQNAPRLMLADDGVASVPLGFSFPFYGELHSAVYVSANGFVAFGRAETSPLNGPIPSAQTPNGAVYALWTDLDPSVAGAGDVRYLAETLPDGKRLTVQWTNVPRRGQADANSFQIVLHQSGEIELRYGTITPEPVPGAYTVGIENRAGTSAVSIGGTALAAGNRGFRVLLEGATTLCCAWRADGCFADFNNDTGIDGDDVVQFFSAWEVGAVCADVDDSESVDSDDVVAFFTVWDAAGANFEACGGVANCPWIVGGCFADYDGSGGIDGDDVIAFFADWDAGLPCSDTDASGSVDSDDTTTFFAGWDTGGTGFPGC